MNKDGIKLELSNDYNKVDIKFGKGYEKLYCKALGLDMNDISRFNYDNNDYIESVTLKQPIEYIDITVKLDENGVSIE